MFSCKMWYTYTWIWSCVLVIEEAGVSLVWLKVRKQYMGYYDICTSQTDLIVAAHFLPTFL